MVAVAVKFGVGVALVVAAHFVLVRRWNNGKFFITLSMLAHSYNYKIYSKKKIGLFISDANWVKIITILLLYNWKY